jgi:CheY-like chemotaxis protein
MSDHQQQKLFQAFSQADTSITRKHGGTGLGLVISQRLIELMGGDAIEVESKLGQGSCFRFRLPVALASEEQKSKLKQQDNVIQAQDKLTGHVLLVEDNEINQEVANNQLQDLGLQVTLAENGQLALDLIKQHHFDLVLMDIQMTIMDGYQATRAIREFDQDTPIIALTAAAMIEDKKKALAAGMNGHLSKPINLEELRLLLSNYLLSINTALIKPPQPIAHPIPPHGLLINRQKGLAQLSGNQVLYQKLMAKLATQLAEDYAGLPDDLNSLLVTEQPMPAQWQTLQSLNHALKGVTGNLAVDGLYELSKALDGLLKQQQKPSPDQVNQFTAVFDATLAALIADSSKNMFVNQSGSDAQYQADYSQLQILLKRIKNSEYIDESELAKFSSIVPSKYHQAWLNCQAKLDDFEFEQAAALVQQLMNDLQS